MTTTVMTHTPFPLMTLGVVTSLVVMTSVLQGVRGHGRLMDPPARNSMWRLGFDNPVNYNDNELYCGGRMVQWIRNSGKCGVCGDAYHKPRDHEAGGKYANGIVTRHFRQGDVMPITVHLTANHQGWFEIRMCPINDVKKKVTQECLDKHVLRRADGGGVRFPVPKGKYNAFFNYTVQLPPDLTCAQCVVQWKYRTGNTWDKDDNSGAFCLGCGPQEEFYNCADIAISPDKNAKTKQQQQQHQQQQKKKKKKTPQNFKPIASAKPGRQNKEPKPEVTGLKAEKKNDALNDILTGQETWRKKSGKGALQNRQENSLREKEETLERRRQEVKGTIGRKLTKPRDDRYSWRAGSAFDWFMVTRKPPQTSTPTPTTPTPTSTTTTPSTTTTTTTATTTTTTTTAAATTIFKFRNPFTPPKRKPAALNRFHGYRKRLLPAKFNPGSRKMARTNEGRPPLVKTIQDTTAKVTPPKSSLAGRNTHSNFDRDYSSAPTWLLRLADASRRKMAAQKTASRSEDGGSRTKHSPFRPKGRRDSLGQSLWRHLLRPVQKKQNDDVIPGNARNSAEREEDLHPTPTTPTTTTTVSSTCSTSTLTTSHQPSPDTTTTTTTTPAPNKPRNGAFQTLTSAELSTPKNYRRGKNVRGDIARDDTVRDDSARDADVRDKQVRDTSVRHADGRDSSVRDKNARDKNVRDNSLLRDKNARSRNNVYGNSVRDNNVRNTNTRDTNARNTNTRDNNNARNTNTRDNNMRNTNMRDTNARNTNTRDNNNARNTNTRDNTNNARHTHARDPNPNRHDQNNVGDGNSNSDSDSDSHRRREDRPNHQRDNFFAYNNNNDNNNDNNNHHHQQEQILPYVERSPDSGFSQEDYYRDDASSSSSHLYSHGGHLQYQHQQQQQQQQQQRRPVTQLFQAMEPVPLNNPVPQSGGGGWWQGYSNMVWASVPGQQQPVVTRLECRAVVELGGGMDAWCTANCNANYCPAAMCMCAPSQNSVASPYKLVQARDTTWIQPYRQVTRTSYPTWRPLRLPITVKTTERRSIFASPQDVFQDGDRMRSPFVATYSPFVRRDQGRDKENIDMDKVNAGKQSQYVDLADDDDDTPSLWREKATTQGRSSPDDAGQSWPGNDADVTSSETGNDVVENEVTENDVRSNEVTGWEKTKKRTTMTTTTTMAEQGRSDNARGGRGKGRGRRRRRKTVCRATGLYTGVSHYDTWCTNNCAQAMCPVFLCACQTF